MSAYVGKVGNLTDPENFKKAVEEANANGELENFDASSLEPSGFDPVTKPSHYAGHTGIECKAAMESMLGTGAYTAYMQGCAFKYLWRWRNKNGIEDLKKARECIDNVIRALDGDADE